MESALPTSFLRETLLFLVLAGILIPLLQRLRINQVVGFLISGVIIGPYGISIWLKDIDWLKNISFQRIEAIETLAELGIVFLMFFIGLELSTKRIWAMRRWVFGGGISQIILSAVVLGSAAYFLGQTGSKAILLGLILALSSTAVVIQLLTQQHNLSSTQGQAIFAILMMQDFALVPLLILIDLLATKTHSDVLSQVLMTAIKTTGGIVFIFFLGRLTIARLFRCFAQRHQPEIFMALTLLVALSISGATALLGLSMALGAFLAGLLLAETEFRHEVEVTIEPFKGLLMGLFFISIGMAVNLKALQNNYLSILLIIVGIFIIKGLLATFIFKIGGLKWQQSIEGGLLLAQGGELAFILLNYATAVKLFEPQTTQLITLSISLGLLLTPPLALVSKRVGKALTQRLYKKQMGFTEQALTELNNHIIIIGFGRVGQLIGEVLEKHRIPYLAIDQDTHLVWELKKLNKAIVYGNANRPDFLYKIHADQAALLIVTMDDANAAKRIVKTVRSIYPELVIFARSQDEQHAYDLRKLGAIAVVPETLEAGLQLSDFSLQQMGVAESEINFSLNSEREQRIGRNH